MNTMEENYKSVLDGASDAIYVTDLEYNLLYANEKARAIGKNLFHSELYQGKCYEALLGRDTPCPFCKMSRLREDKFLVRNFKGATGRIFELRGKLTVWSGMPAHIEYIQNITEQEEAIRQSEELALQQRNLYSHIGAGVCLYRYRNGERRAVVCNDYYRKLFVLPRGFDGGEALELKLDNFCAEGKAQIYADAMECLRTNRPYQHICRIFDRETGLPRSVLVRAECAVQGEDDILWYITASDVTEWAQQEQQLNNILSSINGGIAVYQIGADGKIKTLMFTEGLPSMTGYTRQEYEELCGDDALNLCYPGDYDRLKKEIRTSIEKRTALSTNFRVPHKDKNYIWVNLTASPGGMDSNGCIRYNATFTNVSQQFELYQKMLDAAETGLMVTDRETKELYYTNQKAEKIVEDARKLCGRREECLVGKSLKCTLCDLSSLVPPEDYLPRKKQIGKNIYQIYTHKLDWMGRPAVSQYFSDITEEVTLQEQLALEEERYRMVVEESGIALMDYDRQHDRIYMNEQFMQYAIAECTDVRGTFDFHKGFETAFSDDHPFLGRFYEQLQKTGTAMVPKLRLKHKDGTYRWSELHGIEINGDNGESVRKLCFIRDIDDITRQNEELQMRYDTEVMRLRSFENGVVERMSLDLTDNRIIEAMSPKADRLPKLIGKTLEELLAIRSANTRSQTEKEKYNRFMDRERLLQAYYRGETPSIEIFAPAGDETEYINFIAATQFAKDPRSGHVIAFIETRNNDKEKIQSVLMWRILETNYESALVINASTGRVKMAFKNGEMAYSAEMDEADEELAWESVLEAVLPEEKAKVTKEYALAVIQDKLSGSSMCSGRTERMIEDKPVYKMWTAAYFDQGEKYILFTISNITEVYQKDLENARLLKKALEAAEQASQAKTTFLSNISHEIRTPMNAIMGMTRLAEDELSGNPAVAGYLAQIERSSQYLLGIINDILEMSRIDSGKSKLECGWYRQEDILIPVINMIEPMMAEKGITFLYPKASVGRWRAEFFVDMQKTQQLLMNLLNNACKFTPSGGTVSLRFKNVALDKRACVSTDSIVIEDNGCGMSKEFMSRIFNPFEQERLDGADNVPGTGLGLAISRSIARQMGGDIMAQSELGKGSAFTVIYSYKYRIITEKTAEEEEKQPENTGGLAGKRILLAEDNDLNAIIASKLLERQGMFVDVADNGKKAVEQFSASRPGTYDFILMDVRMPVMDGLEATRQIRALERADAKTVPIVAMSANAYEEDRQLSLQTGMNAHLPKPVEPKLLYETIQKYCGGN